MLIPHQDERVNWLFVIMEKFHVSIPRSIWFLFIVSEIVRIQMHWYSSPHLSRSRLARWNECTLIPRTHWLCIVQMIDFILPHEDMLIAFHLYVCYCSLLCASICRRWESGSVSQRSAVKQQLKDCCQNKCYCREYQWRTRVWKR